MALAGWLALRGHAREPALLGLDHTGLAALLPPAWVLSVSLTRGYETGYLGNGSEEYRRLLSGALALGAVLAALGYFTRAPLEPGVTGTLLGLGTLFTLAGRNLVRQALWAARRRGRMLHRAVVVGTRGEVLALARAVGDGGLGVVLVGVVVPADEVAEVRQALQHATPPGQRSGPGHPRPEVAALPDLLDVVGRTRADTLAVAGPQALGPEGLRRLSWQLEATGVDLLVAPVITNVAGPRISVRPVAGLPLLHVEEPELRGPRRALKHTIDRCAAAALLLVLLLPGLVVAAAIKATSPGPVFFRQPRLGFAGRQLRVWKLRTMRDGADRELPGLLAANESDGALFKLTRDPRVTPLGRVLRRFSVDELPQLLNVLRGEMSLVGPRPLPVTLDDFDATEQRRLLVRPGMTGLWQVSGRSDLSWDDAVRLDLHYVENWSPALDAFILWRTVRVVLRGDGAY